MFSRMQAQKQGKIKSPATLAAAKAALRIQLQLELLSKKQCAYKPYECTQLTLDGYDYCVTHILADKNAPYMQCSYIYTTTGKRCHIAASKLERKEFGIGSYCPTHALKTHLIKVHREMRQPLPKTSEVLLHSLSHYISKPRTRTVSASTQYSDDNDRRTPDEGEVKVTRSLDPYLDIDAVTKNASCSDVLNMCSESESDIEPSTYTTTWHDAQADSSENESIDSDQEDVLKHSNVYTAEEITLVTRDKLIRLQSLYIDQYKHLQHLLRERRRKYIHALKREKETYCSIHNQMRERTKEQRLYKKLKLYSQYHRKHGVEAILNKRVRDLRMKITEGMGQKPHTYTKCMYVEGGVKCGERALPVARHCRKHILEDSNQVLFRACGKMRADVECNTPIEAIFDDSTCRLHMDIPPLRSYNQVRKDSESDYDDRIEHGTKVKTEIRNQIDFHEAFASLSTGASGMKQIFVDRTQKKADIFGKSTAEIKEDDISFDGFEKSNDTSVRMVRDESLHDLDFQEERKDELMTSNDEFDDLDLHINEDSFGSDVGCNEAL